MKRTWLVARHEYLTNLRRPAFLFAAFGAPILITIVMVIVFAVVSNVAEDESSIGLVGYVDLAGVTSDTVAAKPPNFVHYDSEEAARAALDSGELGAYFVVPETYLSTGRVPLYGRSSIPKAVPDAIEQFLLTSLGARLGDAQVFARVENPVELTVRVLDSGRELNQEAAIGLFLVPIVFAVVFMMSTQTTSGYLMSGVVEEKANRVMEILITSITPLQLLLGKIIGLGALGLTQLVIWLVLGTGLLAFGQNAAFLSGVTVPLDLVLISLVYFVLSYFLFAGIMAGIGASAGSEQESRQYAGLFGFVFAIPFFTIILLVTNPEHPIVTLLTLIPFTSAPMVILRMSLGTVPAWQMIASVGLLVVTTIFVVWGMARVFRWSLLLYGKRPTPRQLWRVIRGAAPTKIGTAATTGEQTA